VSPGDADSGAAADGPPEITELDAETVDRIAAGEVVERPASAVKELVENAIDADASRVSVEVEAGGADGIVVRDDGVGMSEAQVRRAVREHTTSKIDDVADLEAGVGTLGFRGEALHAIGAVSRLTIRTRPRGGARGTELVVEGGEVTRVEPVGCPAGTVVEVSDLFFNVPARRKYLKTESTEFGHVQAVTTAYALANPAVAVSLSHEGRETFATTGDGDRRAAVMAVYGREVAADMIAVTPDHDPGGPLAGVSGLVSHPETNRAGREYLNAFVNGRYVTASAVREAVVDAYGRQLAADRYPFAVVDLSVDPGTVDVNVHPRKLHVRFSAEEAVTQQVRTAVENALLDEGLLRSSAPRGRSAPEQATIDPASTDVDSDDDADDATATTDTDEASAGDGGASEAGDATERTGPVAGDADALPSSGTDPPRSTSRTTSRSQSNGPASTDAPSRSTAPEPSSGAANASSGTDSAPSSKPHPRRRRSTPASELETQTTLDGDDAHPTTEYDNFPALRVLGQLHDTYVVAEADDGLILIDQHAADERINYERLKERFEGDTTTQALADPVRLELTAHESELFTASEDALARLGFRANRVDDRTIELLSVPALVAESAEPDVIRDVLADMVTGETAAEETVEAVADELLADMACYPSITGNTSLTDGSVVDLLSALDDCDNPWACPHGRPVLTHIGSEEIDDRFERDYPGHYSRF
jgi:DNA mismatch repair protein MutL